MLFSKALNSFVPTSSFRYPLKTSENLTGRERVYWEQIGECLTSNNQKQLQLQSCFSENSAKFWRTYLLQNTSGWLLKNTLNDSFENFRKPLEKCHWWRSFQKKSTGWRVETKMATLILPGIIRYFQINRISYRRCFIVGVLKNFASSQENTFVRGFLSRLAGLSPATLLKNRLWHRCFPVNFAKVLRTTLQNISDASR